MLKSFRRITLDKVVGWSYWALAIIIAVSIAYAIGTFKPNDWARSKIERVTENRLIEEAKEYGFHAPEFRYTDQASFIKAVNLCVNYLNMVTEPHRRIPSEIIIGMAMIESANGTSRFAVEGNALFGVRTWNLDTVPHMKPAAIPNARFGVKKYVSKCQSVEDVIDIINRHPAYEPFRSVRNKNRYEPNITQMVFGLSAWSTNDEYPQIILQKIEQLTNK